MNHVSFDVSRTRTDDRNGALLRHFTHKRAGPFRIALYSHDTQGFGHIRRNILLARALRQIDPQPDILLIAGMAEAGAFHLPEGVDMLSLPAYGKGVDGSYRARKLGIGLNALVKMRSESIRSALLAYDPDIFIVDNVPRGAQGELDAVLAALRQRGHARIVLGLRDVLDAPAVVRNEWVRKRNFATLRAYFDETWVYGDPNFFDLTKEYGFGDDFRRKTVFMGYLDQTERVARADPEPHSSQSPYILCAVGGGSDGSALCQAFLKIRLPDGHRGVLITGTQMQPDQRAAIAEHIAVRDDIDVYDFIAEPLLLMRDAARVIAMGGYNTVSEAISLGRPTLIVPRIRPRQEQLLRAERLAEKGLIDLLVPEMLSAERLSAWLEGPAPDTASGRSLLDLGGLDKVRQRASLLLAASALQIKHPFDKRLGAPLSKDDFGVRLRTGIDESGALSWN